MWVVSVVCFVFPSFLSLTFRGDFFSYSNVDDVSMRLLLRNYIKVSLFSFLTVDNPNNEEEPFQWEKVHLVLKGR